VTRPPLTHYQQSFVLELDRDRHIMSEEATSQDAIMPLPAETRPDVTESMPATEKVEAPVESATDPIEQAKEVAPAVKVAPVPAVEVALVEKGMTDLLFPVTIFRMLNSKFLVFNRARKHNRQTTQLQRTTRTCNHPRRQRRRNE
jgi:hypothetical protein